MSFTNDPLNNPVDAIRLMTGDIDHNEEILSDEIYKYYLFKTKSHKLAAIEALKAIVASLANCVTEKAGGLFVKDSERYEQYKALLNKYTKDPSYTLYTVGTPYAGGISKSDMETNAADTDNNINNSTISASNCIVYP